MGTALTIGMATYDDFNGVYFTVQCLRELDDAREKCGFSKLLSQCELVVVDNNPSSPQAARTKRFLESVVGDFRQARYVPYTEKIGTSAPRQHVFDTAQGEFVLCVDSHVIFQFDTLQALFDYYGEHPETRDLISGPMVYDDRRNISTHFTDVIRHGMWGVWGRDPRGDIFDSACTGEAFEIGAQGLGFFSCRKDAWLGFNKEFDGFGGEEWYIHEKFKNAGNKCICIPKARWGHRFNEGQTYPRTKFQKIRNYIIGARERGASLDRFYSHFVEGKNEDGTTWPNEGYMRANMISPIHWDALIKVPTPSASSVEAIGAQKKPGGCQSCEADEAATLDELFEKVKDKPSDINQHVSTLRELAAKCDHVTDFGMRHLVSTTALLAGQPKKLVSYSPQPYKEITAFQRLKGATDFQFQKGGSLDVDIEETDLLFIDTKHTAAQLSAELARHASKVRRYIVRHDTVIYGHTGEDGGPGLQTAIAVFVRANPEWTVIRHDRNNYGLMVLSKSQDDQPKVPWLGKQAVNYAVSSAKWAAQGFPKVSEEQFDARMNACALCTLLTYSEADQCHKCSECGCPIADKALRATDDCPHPTGSKWPKL